MSSDSSNSGISGGLAPIGGWKSGDGPASPAPLSPLSAPASPVAPPPAPVSAPRMGGIGASPAPLAPALLATSSDPLTPLPPAGPLRSRFDAPPTSGAGDIAVPGSRFAAPSAAAAPVLAAAPPERERAYNMASAYRRGEVEPMGGGRMVAGIVTGTVVGGIATILWIMLYLYLPFWQILFVGGGMGFLVGFSVFKATGEGEEASCWISCIISTIYAVGGILFINIHFFSRVGIPDIVAMVFGVFAIGVASERGFRTPEVLAVETAV